VRTCVGCRTRAPASELVRVTFDSTLEQVVLDADHLLGGRGAWLHRRRACARRALTPRGLGRAVRRPLSAAALARLQAVAAAWPDDCGP
jgi:predicted RNA-binding protein YlxR (DUF448 family)